MCGLAGILNYGNSFNMSSWARALAINSAVRGTDATGYAYALGDSIVVNKKGVKADKLKFKIPNICRNVIIHTRHTTQGNAKKNINNHPWIGHTKDGSFALAHNGVIYNDVELRKEYLIPHTKIETDSFIAVQLLEHKNKLDFNSLKFMAEKVMGSYSFSILDDKGNLYIVKGDSPISLVHIPSLKVYLYASTYDILMKSMAKLKLSGYTYKMINLKEGDILKICNNGNLEYGNFEYSDNSLLGRHWWDYGFTTHRKNDYRDELMQVAYCFGYSKDQIQTLLDRGLTYEEIEDYLYDACYEMEENFYV